MQWIDLYSEALLEPSASFILKKFCRQISQQAIGISMGSNCAPYLLTYFHIHMKQDPQKMNVNLAKNIDLLISHCIIQMMSFD